MQFFRLGLKSPDHHSDQQITAGVAELFGLRMLLAIAAGVSLRKLLRE
ncbi:MAG: Uncharacterised protein [Prochlorococcus marinus str. MIT 9215]|nr:MAG: Uncharacterised protein [Prochlorococcus marinus str. MIT 9215]